MARITLPPGPKEPPLIGSVSRFGTDLPQFLARMGRDYGDLATFHLGPRPVILVNKPEYIELVLVREGSKFIKGRGLQRLRGLLLGQGLLTSEHEFHMRQRRLAQPAFMKQRLDEYARCMADFALEAVEGWVDGERRLVVHDMMELALRIVAKTCFSEDLGPRMQRVADALTEFMDAFPIHMVPGSELLDNLPIPSTKHTQHARKVLDEVIYGILAERRADPTDRGDLLSMLMLARDEEGGPGMSDEQLRDEAMTLILAGHETTANAMAWTLYLLSQNSGEYRQLFEEVDRVLDGRPATRADIDNLPHTRNCFMEGMRLYPPVWVMDRECTEEVTFGGYTFPKGTLFFLSPLVTHRDHRFFDAPMLYKPDRWSAAETKKRHRYSFFPFGGGQRYCMGERFAMMEATLVLASIAQRWEHVYQEHWACPMNAMLTLRPRGGLPMEVRRRGPRRPKSGKILKTVKIQRGVP